MKRERLERIATCGWLAVHERVTPDETIWMATRIAALEAQVRQLRDAAVALLSIGPNSPEECCEGEGCEWCDMKAALAATEKP